VEEAVEPSPVSSCGRGRGALARGGAATTMVGQRQPVVTQMEDQLKTEVEELRKVRTFAAPRILFSREQCH